MPALKFGAFLAPHHPIGENPTAQFQSNLEFVQHWTTSDTTSSGAASTTRLDGR